MSQEGWHIPTLAAYIVQRMLWMWERTGQAERPAARGPGDVVEEMLLALATFDPVYPEECPIKIRPGLARKTALAVRGSASFVSER